MGNLLDRHNKQHCHIPGALPLGDGDNRVHGRLFAAQPDLCQPLKSDHLQKTVEQAHLGIIDKVKQQAHHSHGDHCGDKIDTSQGGSQLSKSHILQNRCQHQAETHLYYNGYEGVQNIIFQTGQNDLV